MVGRCRATGGRVEGVPAGLSPELDLLCSQDRAPGLGRPLLSWAPSVAPATALARDEQTHRRVVLPNRFASVPDRAPTMVPGADATGRTARPTAAGRLVGRIQSLATVQDPPSWAGRDE